MSEIEYEELTARLGTVPLIDVRTEFEHSGQGGYPCCARQGHIPGSRHIPVEEILGLAPAELKECVGEPEGAELVVYCHGGGRSARAAAALQAAGFNARNYGGSWHEWSHVAEE